MKTFRSAAIFAVVPFLLASCSSAVTSERMAEIKPGMNVSQVEKLLGKPAHIDQSETTGLKGQVYAYPANKDEGQVIFLNDTVFKSTFLHRVTK